MGKKVTSKVSERMDDSTRPFFAPGFLDSTRQFFHDSIYQLNPIQWISWKVRGNSKLTSICSIYVFVFSQMNYCTTLSTHQTHRTPVTSHCHVHAHELVQDHQCVDPTSAANYQDLWSVLPCAVRELSNLQTRIPKEKGKHIKHQHHILKDVH